MPPPQQQPVWASEVAQVKDTSLDTHGWPLLPCTHSRLAPPAVHLHSLRLAPINSIHCHKRAQGEIVQPQESTLISRAPSATCKTRMYFVFCHWPHHCIHLQPSTPSVHQYASGPNPITGLHFYTPEIRLSSHSITASQGPCSHQCTYNWPWPFLPASAPTTTSVFAIAPYHCTEACC